PCMVVIGQLFVVPQSWIKITLNLPPAHYALTKPKLAFTMGRSRHVKCRDWELLSLQRRQYSPPRNLPVMRLWKKYSVVACWPYSKSNQGLEHTKCSVACAPAWGYYVKH